jgi:hypothetical protein
MIEVAAVGFQVGGVEDRSENALHILDVLADADLGAGLRLHIRRAGQVVGMGVCLERPGDAIAFVLGKAQHRLDRAGIDLAGAGIVVEHRIDERRLFGGGIGNKVADRIGRLVEESMDNGLSGRFSGHGDLLVVRYILANANLAMANNTIVRRCRRCAAPVRRAGGRRARTLRQIPRRQSPQVRRGRE